MVNVSAGHLIRREGLPLFEAALGILIRIFYEFLHEAREKA
jgi:hypothetical protein